jgi:putative endonuclease
MLERRSKYYIYIIEDSNGAYYTGYTNNLENRIKLHSKGNGAKYLRGKGPLKLVYAKEYRYLRNAMRTERNIKKYPRKKKEELTKIWTNAKLNAGAPMLRFLKKEGVI